MSINDFVEMIIFMCLICFSIYAKMQGFIDSVCVFMQKFKMAAKNAGKRLLGSHQYSL